MKEKLKLHEAMIRVIEESHKEYMTPREIADEINKRRLYEKGDGQMILSGLISARANQYPQFFNKQTIDGHSVISLKS